MKKELILASLMASSVATTLSAEDRSSLITASIEAQKSEDGTVFLSAKTFASFKWVEVIGEDGRRDWVKEDVTVRLRITFLDAGVNGDLYTYDGKGNLDYEMIIELIDEATGDVVRRTDTTYYAKREGQIKYSIYDCDSTARCSDDYGKSKFYVFEAPEGRGLKLKTENLYLPVGDDKTVLFYEQD
ncbi:MAG: hypothetical protein HRU19_27460 [Pseudobacteriovorax sp.]|nr:hypothetical protein [Pseudobacteriovorax sp.]